MLFGVYEPKFTVTRMLAPLMNGNHLAGFSLTGSLIAAGLATQSDTSAKRYGWTVTSAFCALTVAWTLSRGALGALLFGFLLFGAWLASRSQKRSKALAAAIPAAVVGAAIAGVGAFALLEPILRRFERHGFDKLELATRSFGLLDGSVWWLGVGRGAFSSAFVSHEGTLERYTHPENLVAQWTTEWGLPVAVALGLVLAWSSWKAFRRSDRPLVAASWIAIFALSLQNLVDFSLEMAGVVAPIAALLGALLPATSMFSIRLDRRISAVVLGLFVVVLTLLGPRVLESDTQSLVERLTWQLRANDDDAVEATLRRGLSLHPTEPALALLAGTHASAIGHPDTGAWLSVAMDGAPGWGEPHAVAARWLLELGQTDQALLEVREAEERHGGRGQAVLCEILRQDPRYELVERGAPTGSERAPYLNRAARCKTVSEDLRRQIDQSILESAPSHPWAALREAQRLSKEGRSEDAVSLLESAIQRNAGNQTLEMALIAEHVRAGHPERAQDVLQRVTARDGETRTVLIARARVEAALGEADAMRATLMRVRGDSRGSPDLVASSFVLEGELEASLGNVDEALTAYAAADVARPESSALRAAAALALRSGRTTYALRTYRELCRRDPGGRDCAKEAQLTKKLSMPPSERPVP